MLNTALNATYHSRYGAVQESRHIFIEQGLHYAAAHFGNDLRILEIGFGTGLNAALTLDESAQKNYIIHYTAIEKYPLPAEVLKQLNYEQFLSQKSAYDKVIHCTWNKPEPLNEKFNLYLAENDANSVEFPKNIHLVYFDAFAPQVTPDLWEAPIFARLFEAMAEGGVLVTFCAQGGFKRLLKQTGFHVEALPGPPGKREMTRAVKPLATL